MSEYYRKHGSASGWVLKGDVRHFFASIDHRKLKRKLKRLFERRGLDMRIYDLLCVYIDTTEGLPLGYQTSQLFALLFLDEFDHFIKEGCQIRWYGRYMDDFYIICEDKKTLKALLKKIREWMNENDLELNEKTAIFPLRNGIDFLGFHTYLTDTGAVVQKLRQDSIDRIKGRIRYWRKAYPAGEITKDEVIRKWKSWDAHAAHGDTYALREKFAKEIGSIIGEKLQPHRKITASPYVKQQRRMKQWRRDHPQTAPAAPSEPRPEGAPPWE